MHSVDAWLGFSWLGSSDCCTVCDRSPDAWTPGKCNQSHGAWLGFSWTLTSDCVFFSGAEINGELLSCRTAASARTLLPTSFDFDDALGAIRGFVVLRMASLCEPRQSAEGLFQPMACASGAQKATTENVTAMERLRDNTQNHQLIPPVTFVDMSATCWLV